MSQEQLAPLIGVTGGWVSQVERGLKALSEDSVSMLKDVLPDAYRVLAPRMVRDYMRQLRWEDVDADDPPETSLTPDERTEFLALMQALQGDGQRIIEMARGWTERLSGSR